MSGTDRDESVGVQKGPQATNTDVPRECSDRIVSAFVDRYRDNLEVARIDEEPETFERRLALASLPAKLFLSRRLQRAAYEQVIGIA
ncbi:hypothetical protein [Methylosinus sp. Sm6]|uniref:hypothetical protein n=1 Tax=Methylosinus sp. Sm6 TaxID=2866948 RepID=UPI001C9948A0|nr:hypothetical protein [Methylosinus sp. Sm6]MBY6243791.1 hypothetical protein [Methylosinus sp. Sm6]